MARAKIPIGPEELSAEWLTRALRERGVLGEERITHWREETLGDGEGFMGRLSRLHLQFDPPAPEAPATLIAKFPTLHVQNRALGEISRSYEREIHFYDVLAHRVPVATPRCYYGAMDPDPAAALVPAVEWIFRRLPVAVAGRLVQPLLWIVKNGRRRYVLLLEDLAPTRVGDQVAGCSEEAAERILRAVAAAHAEYWQSPRLSELSWLARIDYAPRFIHALYRRALPRFSELASRFPAWTPALAQWLDAHGPALLACMGSPPITLLHGDYRLDNLFYDPDGNKPGITAVDWQAAACGRAVFDVAYFLTGNLDSELAGRCESRLVAAWCEELAHCGVTDYPFEICWRDYELSKLHLVYRMVSGLELIDLSQGRGARLLDCLMERTFARVPEFDGIRIG